MTGRATIVSLVTVGVVLAVGMCSELAPKKLPKAMQEDARVEYRVQMVVDSARVKELEAENLRLARTAATQIGRARKADSIAAEFRAAADSIKADAYRAPKVEQKAQLWEEAAHTYQLEADASRMASKTKDSTLAVRDSQIITKDGIISTTAARAARAESRVAELEPLALRADDCKIVWFVNCPSRKQAFVAGVATATVAAVVVLAARQAHPRSDAAISRLQGSEPRPAQSPTIGRRPE